MNLTCFDVFQREDNRQFSCLNISHNFHNLAKYFSKIREYSREKQISIKQSSQCFQILSITQELKSLRGGGCGTSIQERQVHPSQDLKIRNITKLPNYFLADIKRHLNIITERANLAYEEKEKEQILISIQWFNAMREHFNTLCKDTISAASTYDLIFEQFPKLLISTVTYLRISGFLCLQILQIANDLARVLFTFFMTNKDRFMKIKDKEYLEELIADFETQLNIETQNIWVAGAEFEITMIKAVVQGSPSDSKEGKKLLISFVGGLVKSCLTMTPSEDLIDSLINGAKFLYKAYKTNKLKIKYEVDYYFQSLKWQVIQLLKQNTSPYTLLKYLIHAYKSYIENSNDWLINFCWVKMIASIITYRPIIQKQEISNNLMEQSQIWNQLIKKRYLCQFSFNKNIGRLQWLLGSSDQNHQIIEIFQKYGLKAFEKFHENLLRNLLFQSKNTFQLCENNQKDQVQRDYFNLLLENNQNIIEYKEQYENLFAEITNQIKQIRILAENIQIMKTKDQGLQKESYDFKPILNLSFCLLSQTMAIRNTSELQLFKNSLIIKSINADPSKQDIIQFKHQLQQQISYNDELNQKSYTSELIELIKTQTQIVQSLVILQQSFEEINQNDNYEPGLIFQQIKILDEMVMEIGQKCKQYFSISPLLQIGMKFDKSIKFELNNPFATLNQTISKILGLNPIRLYVLQIIHFYQTHIQTKGQFKSKFISLNTLKYLIQNLIPQIINFQEILEQILQFVEKNIGNLSIRDLQKQKPLINEQSVQEILKTELQIIINYFFQEEQRIIDEKKINTIQFESILTLLKQDFEWFDNQQIIEKIDQLSIRQAIAFVEQYLLQYQQYPEMLPLMKEQIILIYRKLNIQQVDMNLNQKIIQFDKNYNFTLLLEIEQIKKLMYQLNVKITSTIQGLQKILSKRFKNFLCLIHQQLSLIIYSAISKPIIFVKFQRKKKSFKKQAKNNQSVYIKNQWNYGIAQIDHILTTPFMMEIVVQVLPSLTATYSDPSEFKDKFISNFIQLKKKQSIQQQMITFNKNKKGQKNDLKTADDKLLRTKANKIWDQLQNDKYFQKFSLVDKIDSRDLSTIDSADIVARALIVKQLTVFDFYMTFVEYYHLLQIRKQLELGRPCNQESLLIDLFNFSQSLALDLTLRQLTQTKSIQKGQLKLKFVKNNNEKDDWKDTYFNDFESNGDYKKVIRSCILLTKKGSNQSFSHKSIQEFFVAHFLLNLLKDIELIDLDIQDLQKYLKWENNQIQLKVQIPQNQQIQIMQAQNLLVTIVDSIFNKNEFNLSTDNYKGVIFLIKDEMKQSKKLKQKLLQIVKLSAISSDFTRASSNSLFLLGFNNELLKSQQLKNIQITDTQLMGLSFYGSDLEGSVLRNVNINSCNFSNVNLKNVQWNDIQCNELHSIIGNNYFLGFIFFKNGQQLYSYDSQVVYSCEIEKGTCISLIQKGKMIQENEEEQKQFSIRQIDLSFTEQFLVILWYANKMFRYGSTSIIQLWDVQKQQNLHYFLELNEYFVQLIFTMNDQYLVGRSQLNQGTGKIFLWNLIDFSKQQITLDESIKCNYIAISPNVSILCSSCSNRVIKCWELQDIKLITTLEGHKNSVNQIVFKSDGNILASSSDDKTIILWNMITFQNICVLQGHIDSVRQLYFLTDDQTLISLGQDKRIIIWNINQCQQLNSIESSSDNNYKTISISSDNSLLAQKNKNEIQILDIKLGKVITAFEGQSKNIQSIQFQPGTYILSTVNEHSNSIQFWNAKIQKSQNNLEGHTSQIKFIIFSPDSMKLVSWANDFTLRIWNVKNGKQLKRLNLIDLIVKEIQFSYDAQYLIIKAISIKSQDRSNMYKQDIMKKRLFIFFINEEKLIQIDNLKQNQSLMTSDIVFQQNGKIIAWAVKDEQQCFNIKLWDMEEKKTTFLIGHKALIDYLIFSQDGQILISSSNDGTVLIWNITQCCLVQQFEGVYRWSISQYADLLGIILESEKETAIIFNFKQLVQVGMIKNLTSDSFSIQSFTITENIFYQKIIWNINDGKKVGILENTNIIFSPKGDIFIQFMNDSNISILNIKGLNLITKLQGHSENVKGAVFSKNGQFLVSHCEKKLIIWDAINFELKAVLIENQQIEINQLEFSPDFRTLAVRNFQKIYLFNVMTGLLLNKINGDFLLQFSPDCNLIAYYCYYNEDTIKLFIWNIKENQITSNLAGCPPKQIQSSFTYDSIKFIAKVGYQIIQWDVITGQLLEIIDNYTPIALKFVISYDSKNIVTYGNDQIIQVWDPKLGEVQVELLQHQQIVVCIVFSSNNKLLVSGGKDSKIIIWETKEWKSIQVLEGHQNEIDQLLFTPITQRLISASKDHTIRMWDVATGQQLFIFEDIKNIRYVKQLLVSPNEEQLAWHCQKQSSVLIINLCKPGEIKLIQAKKAILKNYFFTQDSTLFVFQDKSFVYFWNIAQQEIIFKEEYYCQSYKKGSFQLNENFIAGVLLEKAQQIFIWNNQNKQQLFVEQEHTNVINQVAFSSDEKILASSGFDGMIKLWDLQNYCQNIEENKCKQFNKIENSIFCYKTLALYQPLVTRQCNIQGAEIISKIGWNLKQLFIQKGGIE